MSGQAWLFLSTVAAGFIIGLAYDIFRILRKTVPHRAWIVQVEDLIYWLAASLLMFHFMMNRNYGEIRFFSILGAALGMVVYFLSISPLVMKVSVAILEFLKKVIVATLRIVLTPVRFIIKFVANIVRPPAKWILKNIKRSGATKFRGLRRNIFVMLKKI